MKNFAKKNAKKYIDFYGEHKGDIYYILTRLYKRDGKIEIDYEYQKIIGKTDIETFNCENIYEINIGE